MNIILELLFNNLTSRVTIILILAFMLSRIGIFRKLVSKQNLNIKDILLLSIIFGVMGIIGTYTGIYVQGAIANARVIGVFVGGLLGGPIVGTLSGIIAGGHRYLIDIGGFTAFACSLSTIIEGVMAGFLKEGLEKSRYKVLFSLFMGIVAEIIQMIIILLLAKPFSEALKLVQIIGIPMIVANGIGIAVFIAITESIFKEIESESAYQAQLALKIANKTLSYFRKGYNEDTANSVAKIIKDMTYISAVSFTDNEKILAHIGVGEDHHLPGSKIQTKLTKEVLTSKRYKVANIKKKIGCEDPDCLLRSAITVPLLEQDKIIGSLKLYKEADNAITKVETELALGLAQIFSTQIELGKIDIQRELLAKSELKALQAQINPHFLFNAINTIVSFIRTQPEDARNLLIHLGNYFRNNLNHDVDEVYLSKEIDNINSYIAIEKARFGDKLNIIYHISEEIDCKLPPLLIQPIVENAIKHGVLNKVDGGKVEVIAKDEESQTKIIVKDDGVGMPQKLIDYLLSDKPIKDRIGIRNVNERLKNKYGEDWGLDIKSEINKGTEVTIVIPK